MRLDNSAFLAVLLASTGFSQTEAAALLQVNARTMRRWVEGSRPTLKVAIERLRTWACALDHTAQTIIIGLGVPVVIDNVPFHKVAGVEESIQAAGASLRYLPQYSPEFNPIELVFHPLKTVLRKAAERTIEGLTRRVRSFIRALDPSECMGYFRHAGYGAS